MTKKTKIVATVSDLNCDPGFLKELHQKGMDVVRLNTAHQTHGQTRQVIDNVKSVSDRIGILLDTKGPEVRTTTCDSPIPVTKGQRIDVTGSQDAVCTEDRIVLSHTGFCSDVDVGDEILIDDGDIRMTVQENNEDHLTCIVQDDGVIKNKKSVNVPGAELSLPALSEKDKDYIEFAVNNGVDFIAHSFVRSKEDVLAVQQILDKHGSSIKIIAKIENQQGVDNIDEILDHAYGIMVARGDLGVEIEAAKIPGIQKYLVEKCLERRRPVITATQMMHSMIDHPRPTRAEVSDVANAIYDGSDAIMLSGETAYGKYPVEAVTAMSGIARQVENQIEPINEISSHKINNEISAYLAKAAIRATLKLPVKAIVIDTMSGRTARYLAAYRGRKIVYAQCYDEKVMRQLSLSYGVIASPIERTNNVNGFLRQAIPSLVDKGCFDSKDLIVVLAGSFGVNHGASFIEVSIAENMTSRT
ncbi:MAG: pyruvate kinase [Nanoarchaeota archaeon]